MRVYVVEENIRRFRAQLEQETSPDRRRTVEGLLKEEEAKLAVLAAEARARQAPRD